MASYAPPNVPTAPLDYGVRPELDPRKEGTRIRINLATGQQVELDLNVTHTIADIHTYVMSVCPTSGSY